MDYIDFFSKITNYKFRDTELLRIALTHSSYANEKGMTEYNERLEFLGDSILSLVVSEFLYKEKNMNEGYMSKTRAALVCERSLAESALQIGLGKYLLLGKGEEITNGRERPSVLADGIEALIAALYLDAGFDKAREFVFFLLKKQLERVSKGVYFTDYKTSFQELIQGTSHAKILYEVISENGPDHAKSFEIALLLNDEFFSKGIGKTKKDGEQNAAKEALKRMGKIDE